MTLGDKIEALCSSSVTHGGNAEISPGKNQQREGKHLHFSLSQRLLLSEQGSLSAGDGTLGYAEF